ncbi:hypothetical protein BDZ94DRAFT_1315366 [Collybia nuda]|uniref:Choline/carnitine acyltransferase domain-containing protein n=1 Tax=Collybia nuda TaxID=64659 RepID=A0A9P5XSK1_9AGAR|nr:hypothetical protein BDZ94DRAFT_1315366 [Collybia nuda]
MPSPQLNATLAEASRVLNFLLTPSELQEYEEALMSHVTNPNAPLRTAIDAAMSAVGSEEATSGFRAFLLSRRDPLYQCMLITKVLRTPPGDQVAVAARLLSRLAIIATDPHRYLSFSPSGAPLDPEQASHFLGTTRRVGAKIDTFKPSPSSRHVVVWSNGAAFALEVLDAAGTPLSEGALTIVLKEIKIQSAKLDPAEVSVASLSWNLSRSDWFEARRAIESHVENSKSFSRIDTALATIALEDGVAFSDPTVQLEAIRTARGSVNRYADQVVGLIVYEDGFAGLTVDHAPVDGSIVVEFVNKLYNVPNIPISPESTVFTPLPFVLPPSLPKTFPIDPLNRIVRVTSLGTLVSQSILANAHKSRLLPFIIHMSVQAALLNDPFIPSPLVVQPIAMRHYAGGRSDPSYSRTAESTALVNAILDPNTDLSDPRVKILFQQALASHKAIIKAAKVGAGVGWHLRVMNIVAQQNPDIKTNALLRGWGPFSSVGPPMVYVTGFDNSPGTLYSMSNVYANNMLGCWYNITSGDKEFEISLNIAGSGVFHNDGVLDRLVNVTSVTFDKLVHLAQVQTPN